MDLAYALHFSSPLVAIVVLAACGLARASILRQHMRVLSGAGNVRELEHVIERAVLLSEGEVLFIDPLRGEERSAIGAAAAAAPTQLRRLDEIERDYIGEVLRRTQGAIAGKGGAAEILGLPPSTLRDRMKKLGIK